MVPVSAHIFNVIQSRNHHHGILGESGRTIATELAPPALFIAADRSLRDNCWKKPRKAGASGAVRRWRWTSTGLDRFTAVLREVTSGTICR